MGIWVRSQDKELLKEVNKFYIKELYQHKESKEYYNVIYSCDEKFDKVFKISGSGVYSTKEKAIKVLDMMEKQLIKGTEMNTKFLPCSKQTDWSRCNHISEIVFQMPLDEEVEV